jgi:hypothetical protein
MEYADNFYEEVPLMKDDDEDKGQWSTDQNNNLESNMWE